MLKNSIVAGSVARAFVFKLPPNYRVHNESIKCGKYSYYLTVRMSSRQGSDACTIFAQILPRPQYSEGIPRDWMMSKRLRKSDPETLYRHLADLCETLRQKRTDLLIGLRERVFQLSEKHQYDVDTLPRESSCFDEMPQEECLFWIDWLSKQPLREAA